MNHNSANSKPSYRKPTPLMGQWNYIGDGRLHDPIIGDPAMHGNRWTIDYGYGSGKSYDKFNQGVKNSKSVD